jgi:sarcosine/dimethylglycine N-methyltransferase
MNDATSQTVYFYNRHPISCEIILTKLRASRCHLDGLRPEELYPYDQDHYGGLAATDELARGAQVSNGSRVADFCAGDLAARCVIWRTNMEPTSPVSN